MQNYGLFGMRKRKSRRDPDIKGVNTASLYLVKLHRSRTGPSLPVGSGTEFFLASGIRDHDIPSPRTRGVKWLIKQARGPMDGSSIVAVGMVFCRCLLQVVRIRQVDRCLIVLINQKKPAPKRVQIPTPAMLLWLVTLTFDLLTPKINGFPGLIKEHFCFFKFSDPSCIGFEISRGKNRQTNVDKNPTPATSNVVGN